MDTGMGLAKDGDDNGVCGIDAGQFHIIDLRIWWYAAEDELAGIGIFAFIAFEGYRGEADTDYCYKNDYGDNAQPYPLAGNFAV